MQNPTPAVAGTTVPAPVTAIEVPAPGPTRPITEAEMSVIRRQRSEMSNQLTSAIDRRDELLSDIRSAPAGTEQGMMQQLQVNISRVMAIDTISGTLTLELGGMTIDYTSTTQFRTRSNSNATRSAWEVALIAELSAGLLPSIEARRGPIGSPQDPTSGAFSATDLRITPAITEAQIEVFVDLDNFQEASPPTLAVLTVFGLPVEILNSTQLRRQ